MVVHGYCLIILVSIMTSSAQLNSSGPLERPALTTLHCPSPDMHNTILENIEDEVRSQLGLTQPPCSCGGPARTWRRIAYLNMSDQSQQCPSAWNLFTLSNEPLRGCVRPTTNCVCVTYPSNGKAYSRVCGRILAFMYGHSSAFNLFVYGGRTSLDQAYMDGISVTHGTSGSRSHIWSFAATIYDAADANYPDQRCECSVGAANWRFQVPSFVGNNYFCSTARYGRSVSGYYPDNPMFDGEGCFPNPPGPGCCTFNNPPWFCTTLPQLTTDDLEVRNCHHRSPSSSDHVINLIDIYVS